MNRTCVLVLALGLVQPRTPGADSIQEELRALVEKTNALKSFHLIYDARGTGLDGKSRGGTMEILWRAPDKARILTASEEWDADMWFEPTRMAVHSRTSEGEEWHRLEYPELPDLTRLLDELSPSSMKSHAARTCLNLDLQIHPGASRPVELRFAIGSGPALGWLGRLQYPGQSLTVEDDAFVLTGSSFELSVSRSTGLLESLEVTGEKPYRLELREARLDEAVPDELVEVPPAAREAQPDLEHLPSGGLRQRSFQRIAWALEDERLAWDEHTQEVWRSVLTLLHREAIRTHYAPWTEELNDHAVQLTEWVRAQRAVDDSPERRIELRAALEDSRRAIERDLDTSRSKYIEALPQIDHGGREHPELLDEERRVIADLWDELLAQPFLENLEKKRNEAFE